MLNTNNLLQAEESLYMGRVFTDTDQTLLVIGTIQTTQDLSAIFSQAFNVITAIHDQEIYKVVGSEKIDLIIMDTTDSKKLWVESLRQVRSSSLLNFIPVIVLSKKNSINEQLLALELGALDSLVKPIDPLLFTAKISNYMKLMKNVRELELVSTTDGLTGLANRIQLDAVLMKEWHRMRRSQRPMSALMVEMDHFKVFNDTYGHLEGDKCLKAVADVIKNVTGRDSDFAARFSGEKFVVLLPVTDNAGAAKIAKAVLEKIAALHIPIATQQTKFLTVSIGFASCQPHDIDKQDIEPITLLEAADTNLYQAKQKGCNQYYG